MRQTQELAIPATTTLAPDIVQKAASLALAAYSEATRRAYDTDFALFADWCGKQHPPLSSLPAAPETVAGWLAVLAEAGYHPATVRRKLAAVSTMHRLSGHPTPTDSAMVKVVHRGIRRTRSCAPTRKNALHREPLTVVLARIGDSELSDLRDRALLLIGYSAALRRSELVALDVADIEATADGLIVTVRRSKTDQESLGARVGLAAGNTPATCPMRAWVAWRDAAGLVDGPAFRGVNRHGQVSAERLYAGSVARIVKRRAAAAGLDADSFSGVSLRAGFATAASMAGVPTQAIMHQGRWRSSTSVDTYVRQAALLGPEDPSRRITL